MRLELGGEFIPLHVLRELPRARGKNSIQRNYNCTSSENILCNTHRCFVLSYLPYYELNKTFFVTNRFVKIIAISVFLLWCRIGEGIFVIRGFDEPLTRFPRYSTKYSNYLKFSFQKHSVTLIYNEIRFFAMI